MWQIEQHPRVDKQVAAAPKEMRMRYGVWKDIAAMSGPAGLGLIQGFQDEALEGKWKGYRACRLGGRRRVIYRVIARRSVFQVASFIAQVRRRT